MTVDELRDELRAGARDHDEPLDHLFEVALALGVGDLLEAFGELRDEDAARAVVFALAEHAAAAPEVRALLRASSIPALMAGLRDRSYIVRENAIDELEGLGAREAVPALRAMLDDAHPDVRAAADGALQTLPGG